MKTIILKNGEEAIVDDDMYPILNKRKWYCIHGYAVSSNGYGNKQIRMHRLVVNAPDDMEVDHINRNTLDNRRCNLRLCNHNQNKANRLADKDKKSCEYKGVFYDGRPFRKKRWLSSISVNGNRRHLGSFATPEEARDAYNEAAKEAWGEFAALD